MTGAKRLSAAGSNLVATFPKLIGVITVAWGSYLVVVAFVDIATVLREILHGWFTDWQTYALAALRVSAGGSAYSPAQLTGMPYRLPDMILVGYAYPPASAVLFLPFASYPVGWVLWTTANVGALLTALWAIVSRAWPRLRLLAFGVVLVALANFIPFVEGAAAGNINVMLAGLIGWAWIGGKRRAPIILLPILLAKLPFVAVVAWAVRWAPRRSIVWSIDVLAVLVLGTLPIVGIGAWVDFVRAITNAVPYCYPNNGSIACETPFGLLGGVLVATLCLIGAVTLRHRFAGLVLAVAAVLAATPDLHRSYWTVTVPLAVIGLDRTTRFLHAIRQSRTQ